MRDFIIVVAWCIALATALQLAALLIEHGLIRPVVTLVISWWRSRCEVYPRFRCLTPEPEHKPVEVYHAPGWLQQTAKVKRIVLPTEIACLFEADKITVGGKARVAAYCVAKGVEWPKGYEPRDADYLTFDEKQSKSVWGLDVIYAPSIESYFADIDLVTNAVAVKDGVLYISEEAWQAFSETGLINLNPRKIMSLIQSKGWSGVEYLCLRAAVQAGYDVTTKAYLPRAGALKLNPELIRLLELMEPGHWYMDIYQKKMTQIRSGHH